MVILEGMMVKYGLSQYIQHIIMTSQYVTVSIKMCLDISKP